MRKDLNMPVGLACAQAAHICDAFQRETVNQNLPTSDVALAWCKSPYLSVLAVSNREELECIIESAQEHDLPCHIWSDTLHSDALKTNLLFLVGCSIGPDDFDKISMVTGNLSLY
jgi:peptidyl-tRNA hydrolase